MFKSFEIIYQYCRIKYLISVSQLDTHICIFLRQYKLFIIRILAKMRSRIMRKLSYNK